MIDEEYRVVRMGHPMGVSRRHFLGTAAGAAAALLPMPTPAGSSEVSPPFVDCALLDLGTGCALPESCAGYEAALKSSGRRYVRASAGTLPCCRAAIVPGLMVTEREVARRVAAWLENGGLLVLESGAGFAAAAKFDEHRRFLDAYFALRVERPIDVWQVGGGLCRAKSSVPYVEYTWPLRVQVRDFSRVVPLCGEGVVGQSSGRIIGQSMGQIKGQVIGWIGAQPVAVKGAVGKGTLVFLGSPLGPTLLAGDREARGWLNELLAV